MLLYFQLSKTLQETLAKMSQPLPPPPVSQRPTRIVNFCEMAMDAMQTFPEEDWLDLQFEVMNVFMRKRQARQQPTPPLPTPAPAPYVPPIAPIPPMPGFDVPYQQGGFQQGGGVYSYSPPSLAQDWYGPQPQQGQWGGPRWRGPPFQDTSSPPGTYPQRPQPTSTATRPTSTITGAVPTPQPIPRQQTPGIAVSQSAAITVTQATPPPVSAAQQQQDQPFITDAPSFQQLQPATQPPLPTLPQGDDDAYSDMNTPQMQATSPNMASQPDDFEQ